jgi:hypothetical protein
MNKKIILLSLLSFKAFGVIASDSIRRLSLEISARNAFIDRYLNKEQIHVDLSSLSSVEFDKNGKQYGLVLLGEGRVLSGFISREQLPTAYLGSFLEASTLDTKIASLIAAFQSLNAYEEKRVSDIIAFLNKEIGSLGLGHFKGITSIRSVVFDDKGLVIHYNQDDQIRLPINQSRVSFVVPQAEDSLLNKISKVAALCKDSCEQIRGDNVVEQFLIKKSEEKRERRAHALKNMLSGLSSSEQSMLSMFNNRYLDLGEGIDYLVFSASSKMFIRGIMCQSWTFGSDKAFEAWLKGSSPVHVELVSTFKPSFVGSNPLETLKNVFDILDSLAADKNKSSAVCVVLSIFGNILESFFSPDLKLREQNTQEVKDAFAKLMKQTNSEVQNFSPKEIIDAIQILSTKLTSTSFEEKFPGCAGPAPQSDAKFDKYLKITTAKAPTLMDLSRGEIRTGWVLLQYAMAIRKSNPLEFLAIIELVLEHLLKS